MAKLLMFLENRLKFFFVSSPLPFVWLQTRVPSRNAVPGADGRYPWGKSVMEWWRHLQSGSSARSLRNDDEDPRDVGWTSNAKKYFWRKDWMRKNVEDKTRFLQNIFLFETLAIAITLKFDIDNQNSHIWKEIRFPSHHLWYLFWFSGVYYYMLTWIFRGELGSHEHGEVMMVGSVFYELGRWSYIMTFTERNSSCACNKRGGNWKGGRGVRRGVSFWLCI